MSRVLLAVLLLLGLAVLPVAAQPPDDRYVKVLAGHRLEEGKGFVGVLPLGMSVPDMIKVLGNPAERAGRPLWYDYERGPWKLSVTARLDKATGLVRIRSLIVSGAGAPPTGAGIRIGDSATAVERVYGKAEGDDMTMLYPSKGVGFFIERGRVVTIAVNVP